MKTQLTNTTHSMFAALALGLFAAPCVARSQAVTLYPGALPEVPAAPQTPLPTPPATTAARAEAIARHPALARAGSAFNREFLIRMRCYQSENPGYFENARWPLALAAEIAATLAPAPTPLPPLPADLTVDENGNTPGPRLVGRTAHPHADAPTAIRTAVIAGNSIQTKPYKWGGGHGRTEDWGYDCSGSVSYVLMKAGLLGRALTSGSFANYGEPGAGRWITIYAGNGHVFMTICGIRLDTGGRAGRGESGPRWSLNPRYGKGFVMRHPPGF